MSRVFPKPPTWSSQNNLFEIEMNIFNGHDNFTLRSFVCCPPTHRNISLNARWPVDLVDLVGRVDQVDLVDLVVRNPSWGQQLTLSSLSWSGQPQ